MINKGKSHTSKGKEILSHSSNLIPKNIPTAIAAKNSAPIPAYLINSLLLSFLVFKIFLFHFLEAFIPYQFSLSVNLLKIHTQSFILAY